MRSQIVYKNNLLRIFIDIHALAKILVLEALKAKSDPVWETAWRNPGRFFIAGAMARTRKTRLVVDGEAAARRIRASLFAFETLRSSQLLYSAFESNWRAAVYFVAGLFVFLGITTL